MLVGELSVKPMRSDFSASSQYRAGAMLKSSRSQVTPALVIRSDRGPEFMGDFKDLCESLGIT